MQRHPHYRMYLALEQMTAWVEQRLQPNIHGGSERIVLEKHIATAKAALADFRLAKQDALRGRP